MIHNENDYIEEDNNKPAMIIVFGAISLFSFLWGIFLGWVIWG